ncbi:MAG TPA: tyrosine-type recombinase/integrase [Hyphomonas sp.]|nr:tyrosine-type recombinase/integrase [Candidatus Competibacteraceae bacterium]HRX75180.1 tyrosine-type recombinase/integrase [Hyphomonas sp.]
MKAAWTGFHSPLADPIERYLATKRALGCKFDAEERTLRLLDRFLVEQQVSNLEAITGACLDHFLQSRRRDNPRSHNHLLSVVRRLFEWLVSQQVLPASPLQADPWRETSHSLPFLFEPPVIRRLLEEAGQLPDNPHSRLRGPTYETLFALLAGLGLRVGEVARLDCGDVDLERDVLLIRNSKFGKSRLVPFGPRLSRRLHGYLALREQEGWPVAGSAPLFSWDGKRAIATQTIRNVFHEDLLPRLALEAPAGTAKPRVHGLRHSFAVRTLLRWYREGLDPAARLHYLSTFLGHVNPQSTAVYLTMTSDLLAEANRRFEALAPTPPEARP